MTLKDLLVRMVETWPRKDIAVTFRYNPNAQIASFECEYDGSKSTGSSRWLLGALYKEVDSGMIDWDVAAAFSRAQTDSFKEMMSQPTEESCVTG